MQFARGLFSAGSGREEPVSVSTESQTPAVMWGSHGHVSWRQMVSEAPLAGHNLSLQVSLACGAVVYQLWVIL